MTSTSLQKSSKSVSDGQVGRVITLMNRKKLWGRHGELSRLGLGSESG